MSEKKIGLTAKTLRGLMRIAKHTEDIFQKLPMPLYVDKASIVEAFPESLYQDAELSPNLAMYLRAHWYDLHDINDETGSLDELSCLRQLAIFYPDQFIAGITNLKDFMELEDAYGFYNVLTPAELAKKYDIETYQDFV